MMRSYTTSPDHDHRPFAAALQRSSGALSTLAGISPDQAVQRKYRQMINSGPYMAAQQKRLARMAGEAVQRQGTEEDEELLQGKFVTQQQSLQEDEELLQGKFVTQRQSLEEDEEPAQQKPVQRIENNTGMPDDVKTRAEGMFNTDFSHVRVHPNSGRATEVGALAYTQGSDIHFAPGQFKPESSSGQQLLGHELAHVVQQSQGRVQPTGEVAGLPVNDSPTLEKEADVMGSKL